MRHLQQVAVVGVRGALFATAAVIIAVLAVGGSGALQAQEVNPSSGFSLHVDAGHTDYIAGRRVLMHHFCKGMTSNVVECLMFDQDAANAKLLGIEAVITTAQWRREGAAARRRWHNHQPEVESGNIKLVGVPADQEAGTLAFIKQTYGQAIFFWRAGAPVPTKPAFGQ